MPSSIGGAGEGRYPRYPQGDLEAIATVAAFLVHLEREKPRTMYGSHRVEEAIEALAHLVGVPPDKLRLVGNAGNKIGGK